MEECPEDGYVYRFGGDEFVAFFPCYTPEDGENFRTRAVSRLAAEGICISMGLAVTQPSLDEELEFYLHEADKDMYKIKNSKKKCKGSTVIS